jgi:hypothetical protein
MSPAAVKEWGTAEVIWPSATEKSVELLSVTFKTLVTLPLEPMFILNRSPDMVVDDPGAQLKYPSLAFVGEVVDVEVDSMVMMDPEVKPSAETLNILAVVSESAVIST